MAGFRPSPRGYDPDADPELSAAIERYAAGQEAQPELPALDMPPPNTSAHLIPPGTQRGNVLQEWMRVPSRDAYQRNMSLLDTGAQARNATLPILPDEESPPQEPMARYRWNETKLEQMFPPPQPRQPAMQAKAGPPRGPKMQLALHFARAMGRETDAPIDSPEEIQFAKAAYAAMLKMSKGKSIAQFLSGANGAKAAAQFKSLLDAEMAKGAKPSPKMSSAPIPGASP